MRIVGKGAHNEKQYEKNESIGAEGEARPRSAIERNAKTAIGEVALGRVD